MIGHQIRLARERKNLSQVEAAKLAGVHRKQYWKLETDRAVTLETFRRVVTALEMPVVTLGSVKIHPGDADPAELLASARKTLEALQTLVGILEASPTTPADRTVEEAFAAAAADVPPPITEEHPTVKMLHALVDQLAKSRSAQGKR